MIVRKYAATHFENMLPKIIIVIKDDTNILEMLLVGYSGSR